MKSKVFSFVLVILMLFVCLTACDTMEAGQANTGTTEIEQSESDQQSISSDEQYQVDASASIALSDIPDYTSAAYVAINNNQPQFSADEITTTSYEYYSELDSLGRCGTAIACIGIDLRKSYRAVRY